MAGAYERRFVPHFADLPRWLALAAAAYFGGYAAALARTPLWGSNMAFRRELWPAVRPGVHLQIPGLHDDLDFSCNLPAGTRVRFDIGLRVGAAGRVFIRAGGLADSVRRAGATLAANWGTRPGLRPLARRIGVARRPLAGGSAAR